MKRKKIRHLASLAFLTGILRLTGFILVWSLFQCTNAPSDQEITVHQDSMDSIDYFTREVEINPGDEEALFNRARSFYQKGAYDAALKDLRKALEIDSLYLQAYLLKSDVEMDYFRSHEALRTLRHADRLWPNSVPVKESLAKTHLILKQYDQARKIAHLVLEINPSAAQPYLILGLVAKENQDTTSAIGFLQTAVQNDADLLDAWVELAKLKTLKNPEEAAPYFESALQIAPNDLHLWHSYAMYWQNIDSLDHAKNSYQQMIGLDSDYRDAYYNQALILMDQDSFLKAIPLWDQFIDRSPDVAKGFYYRGISYELTQNYHLALENYLAARKRDPKLDNIDNAIESIEQKLN